MAVITRGTYKPTGLKITRDGVIFKFSWKKGETYDKGQKVQYRLHTATSKSTAWGDWHDITVSSTAKQATLTLNANNYYPHTSRKLLEVEFRVLGLREYWSASDHHAYTIRSEWSSKTKTINKPKKPKLSSSWDADYSNRSTYTWEATNGANAPAEDVIYQTVVVKDCPKNVDGLSQWKTASKTTKNLTGSDYHDETGLSGVSKTRVVRVCARGLAGDSEWKYAKHVFAAPKKPTIMSRKVTYNETTHVWNLTAEWTRPVNAQHPVDFYNLQYRIGKPSADMGVTTDNSWVDLPPTTRGDSSEKITEALADDECLWLRVAASHDNHSGANAVVSDPALAYRGKPAAPTDLVISASDLSTREVTISVKNNSAIVDSKVAIVYYPSGGRNSTTVAILSGSGTITQSGIKCPSWINITLGFYAYAFVGDYTYATDDDGVKRYNVTTKLKSSLTFTTGGIPKAPATYSAEKDGDDIYVKWAWTWEQANQAEVSWSTNPRAWSSNQEPEKHVISSTGPAHLYITNVELGKTYYIQVRLLKDDDGVITYGPYTGQMRVDMIDAPVVPVLDVSTDVLKPEEELACSWVYTSTDGTPQVYAEIAEVSSGVYTKVAEATTEQQVSFTPEWAEGTQHDLVLRVVSESGLTSEWSAAVTITVATPPICTITQASLAVGLDGYELQALPLTVTVTGAGTAGQTHIRIVRSEDFTQKRPDDDDFNGYEGDIVLERVYIGEAQQTINLEDLIVGKSLDDTAPYRLIAEITDGYGQTDSTYIDFTVAWDQQPVYPTGIAAVQIQDTAAYITISKPTGAANTDTVDIYRISIDGPKLVYKDAAFGDVIVDPFPTIGTYGGYRVVLKTKYGDYYTSDMVPAWIDYDGVFNSLFQYIDFNGFTLPVKWNVNLDSSFTKRFQKTVYLGGSEEGDFLKGVDREGTITSVQMTEQDVDDIATFRQLAKYSGLAHIRSKDGSSYWANVNVSDGLDYDTCRMYKSITLNIEACDNKKLDGLTQAEWEA